jgi:hypothetical protein
VVRGTVPTTAKADEGAFVFDNPMAGYGAKLTPERATDDACERRVVAQSVSKRVVCGNLATRCLGGTLRLIDCGTTNVNSAPNELQGPGAACGLHTRIAFISVSEPSTLITRFML